MTLARLARGVMVLARRSSSIPATSGNCPENTNFAALASDRVFMQIVK